MKYKDKIEKLIHSTIGTAEPINIDTELQNAGIDSLSFITLIVKIEDYFRINFPDNKLSISEAGTLRKLCTIIINIKNDEEKY